MSLKRNISPTVRINGTVQFTFFLFMKLNVTTVTSCDFLIVILVPFIVILVIFSSLKLENELRNMSKTSLKLNMDLPN